MCHLAHVQTLHCTCSSTEKQNELTLHGSFQQSKIRIITVVKTLWTQEAKLSEFTTNFVNKSTDNAKPHSICFYHNIKDNKRVFCQDLLTVDK